jgi:hypothetical protein
MEWMSPLIALYAAAIAVPLLLLMYFLKLKRRELPVSSTFLWKRAVQDMQVNAPFQRLRRNILLLLQILVLVVIILALAWPVLSMVAGPGKRYVILIDRSASMNAVDITSGGSISRLEKAKEQAEIFVESLRGGALATLRNAGDQTMIIAFDNRARVMCNFTADKRQLISAIEAIEAGDGKSSLVEAVMIAGAFAQSPGTEANNRSSEEPANLILFSDGQIADLQQLTIGPDEMTFHCIGSSGSNIAVTAMQAQRYYENPGEVEVFATIANYDATSATIDVQLSINGNVRSVKSVSIPAAKEADSINTSTPGKTAVNFLLSGVDSGLIEVRQLKKDYLSCDDAAWSILNPLKQVSVLLVTNNNIVLESALKACPFSKFDIRSSEQYEAMYNGVTGGEQLYDVIVLDNYSPAKPVETGLAGLNKGRYLVFGKPPEGIDVTVTGKLENQAIVDWTIKHPVLKYVNFSNFFAASCLQMNLPNDAEVLAEFNQSPALALVRRNGNVFILAGFDVLQTNWPFEPGFVMFCYNAVNYLGMQTSQSQQNTLFVNEPVIVEGLQPAVKAEVDGPGFAGAVVDSGSAGVIRFANTAHAGIYRLRMNAQPDKLFAVNMLDMQESNIAPNRTLAFTGMKIEAQGSAVHRANLPLWPYLVFIALIIVCLEWLVYTYKIKI